MTVNELIERLQEVADDGLGECEVRLAFQPRWALQFSVGGIAVPEGARGGGEADEEPEDTGSVVYIVEGSHPDHGSPYAPSWVFPAAR